MKLNTPNCNDIKLQGLHSFAREICVVVGLFFSFLLQKMDEQQQRLVELQNETLKGVNSMLKRENAELARENAELREMYNELEDVHNELKWSFDEAMKTSAQQSTKRPLEPGDSDAIEDTVDSTGVSEPQLAKDESAS